MGELFATFGIDIQLLIAQIINFGILLVALWYFLYRPVMNMLEARQEKIKSGVADAEKAQERLHEIESERDSIITEATHSAEALVATSKTRAQEQAGEIIGAANTRAEHIVTDAQQRANDAKETALRESREEIGKAAILAAEKILRDKQS